MVYWHLVINMDLILASGSPRRRELLTKLRTSFDVIPSAIDEISTASAPAQIALENACQKAVDVYKMHGDSCVIGCDTVVDLDNAVLGKPKDESEAISMLSALSGRTHFVHTGFCVVSPKGVHTQVVTTSVTFRALAADEISRYVAEKSPLDKAGAYGIQDSDFVSGIDGSYYNVMGFPVEDISPVLDLLQK